MELEQIGAELTARIAGGLSCSLRHPEENGRLQILKWVCEQRGWNPPIDVLRLIAEGITGDARRLLGALNRLWASQLSSGVEPTLSAARKELADLLIASSAGTTLTRIEQVVCEVCGVQPNDLKSSTRTKRVCSARMLAMWLSRQHTSSALSEIGDFFGGRSHSTVISAHKRIDAWMIDDQPFELNSARYPIREAIRLVQRKLRVG
jgi:chromosomal replication initiator protein